MNRKEKPIIFSGPMVRAILAGNKTQTRRVIRFPKGLSPHWYHGPTDDGLHDFMFGAIDQANRMAIDWSEFVKAPYAPGDVLWVRETWRIGYWDEHGGIAVDYKADGHARSERIQVDDDRSRFQRYWLQCTEDCEKAGLVPDKDTHRYEWAKGQAPTRWRPSIFMPREAARLFLKVRGVWVEQLQSISSYDAMREGMEVDILRDEYDPVELFQETWDAINAKRGCGWESNPWVWVIAFERIGDPLQDELNAGADAAHQQVLRSAT